VRCEKNLHILQIYFVLHVLMELDTGPLRNIYEELLLLV
jgi:hypothetical protein